MANHSIGVRVQRMPAVDQAVVLARLAEVRSNDGKFAPRELGEMFVAASLPTPGRIDHTMAALKRRGFATSPGKRARWSLTPLGRFHSEELLSDIDLAALAAEAAASPGSLLGNTVHTVVPPSLAPPGLLPGLRRFLEEHPFETNVFGMTRFPDELDTENPDPMIPALEAAKDACREHGLEFHLASDRAIDDDLWTNVAAHMWASRYGIAFFEDRRGRGMNLNLNIEVGAMLMTGRRCALLKDGSIPRLPTDLVGRIYKSVDLDSPASVEEVVHTWIRDDLGLGACQRCRAVEVRAA